MSAARVRSAPVRALPQALARRDTVMRPSVGSVEVATARPAASFIDLVSWLLFGWGVPNTGLIGHSLGPDAFAPVRRTLEFC